MLIWVTQLDISLLLQVGECTKVWYLCDITIHKTHADILFSQISYLDGIFHVLTNYQRNSNQKHNEVPLHTSQDGRYPKVYKQ